MPSMNRQTAPCYLSMLIVALTATKLWCMMSCQSRNECWVCDGLSKKAHVSSPAFLVLYVGRRDMSSDASYDVAAVNWYSYLRNHLCPLMIRAHSFLNLSVALIPWCCMPYTVQIVFKFQTVLEPVMLLMHLEVGLSLFGILCLKHFQHFQHWFFQ
jgi:hypothetical protein